LRAGNGDKGMAHKSTFKVQFRRRREGKTNYKKRLALITSGLPRLVVRKSNRYIIAQVIEFTPRGDKTIVHVNSKQLEKFGWSASKKNLPGAYLTGLLAGVNAGQKNIEEAILDIGNSTPVHGSFWSAVLKGALDSGLKVSAGKEAMPTEERTEGKHIEQFAAKLGEKSYYGKFTGYAKKKVDAKNLSKLFNSVKEKILKQKKNRGQGKNA